MRKVNIVLFIALLGVCFVGCSVNSAKIDNELKKYFDSRNADGCFTMLDNTNSKVTVYNMELDTMRFSPVSTFDVFTSLVGLETGKVVNDSMIIRWDGVRRPVKEWNRSLNMRDAFKVGSVPYFQEVVRRIGIDTMKLFIDSVGYGNKMIVEPIDSFWLNNSLKISPDEQLGLMKKMYFDQLPFRKSVQQSLREMMLQEDNTTYKFSYKTGESLGEDGVKTGWVIGWVEENNHPYFFVTLVRIKDETADLKSSQINITRDILKHLGFFEGKK